MNVIILVISLIAVVACGNPRPGCEKCRTEPNKCVPDPKQCSTTPCNRYRCIKSKPGVCPRMTVQGSDCKHDQQCPKTEKCCRGNCIQPIGINPCGGCHFGEVCVPIAVACKTKPCKLEYRCVKRKPGVCPRMSVQGSDCKHDQQCPKTEKCCRGNCIQPIGLNRCGACHFGQKCLPIRVHCVRSPCNAQYKCLSTFPKPGKCPIMIARHYGECKYDSQCFRKLKCCNGKCVQPKITARPGRCPYYRFSRCLPTDDKRPECAVDTDCKAPMKCCGHCGKKCTMPMPKHGICPVSRRPCLHKNRKDQCTNDYECKGHDKCCKDECGTLVCVKK